MGKEEQNVHRLSHSSSIPVTLSLSLVLSDSLMQNSRLTRPQIFMPLSLWEMGIGNCSEVLPSYHPRFPFRDVDMHSERERERERERESGRVGCSYFYIYASPFLGALSPCSALNDVITKVAAVMSEGALLKRDAEIDLTAAAAP